MVDTEKLRQAVNQFQSSSAATVGDIKKLIEKTATVLNQFIDELETES